MTKKDLDGALNGGLLIVFDTVGERHKFLKEIKSLGGKWLNGDEIEYDESKLDCTVKELGHLHVDGDYLLGRVSGMCLRFGAFPQLRYAKFKGD